MTDPLKDKSKIDEPPEGACHRCRVIPAEHRDKLSRRPGMPPEWMSVCGDCFWHLLPFAATMEPDGTKVEIISDKKTGGSFTRRSGLWQRDDGILASPIWVQSQSKAGAVDVINRPKYDLWPGQQLALDPVPEGSNIIE